MGGWSGGQNYNKKGYWPLRLESIIDPQESFSLFLLRFSAFQWARYTGMERVGRTADTEKSCVPGLLLGTPDDITEASVCWLVKGGDDCWRRERGKSGKKKGESGGRKGKLVWVAIEWGCGCFPRSFWTNIVVIFLSSLFFFLFLFFFSG